MSYNNPHLAADIAGIQSPITFAGTNKERVGQLISLLSLEGADEKDQRGFLDEMSPACRIHLIRILTDMQTGIVNGA